MFRKVNKIGLVGGSPKPPEPSRQAIDPKKQLWLATVEFDVEKLHVTFNVVHNLPNDGSPFCLQNALDAWLARTSTHTANSFCNYINNKRTGYFAMPEQRFNRISQTTNKNADDKRNDD